MLKALRLEHVIGRCPKARIGVQLSATQSHGVVPQAEYERLVGRKVVRTLNDLDKRKHVEKDDFVISMRSFQVDTAYEELRGTLALSAEPPAPAAKASPRERSC